ncbi:hypothetical protein GWZ87_23195 [Escherichia coli]|nr:hypothetical protein [Escherichia coli]
MADWFIATEGVKVVKDSASLWPQIITAVLSAGTAFGGVWYGQWRIAQREEEAATANVSLLPRSWFFCWRGLRSVVLQQQQQLWSTIRMAEEKLSSYYRKSIIPRYLVTGAPFLLA